MPLIVISYRYTMTLIVVLLIGLIVVSHIQLTLHYMYTYNYIHVLTKLHVAIKNSNTANDLTNSVVWLQLRHCHFGYSEPNANSVGNKKSTKTTDWVRCQYETNLNCHIFVVLVILYIFYICCINLHMNETSNYGQITMTHVTIYKRTHTWSPLVHMEVHIHARASEYYKTSNG